MFPNKSSSDKLTSKTNAFVQRFKEVQPINPTDQVPDLRDTIDCRADNAMKTAPSPIPSTATRHASSELEPCTCALCGGSGQGDRAGPLPCPLLAPPLPVSVISSSTLDLVVESLPPSVITSSGASQSSITSGHQQNCRSSSSNSAQTRPNGAHQTNVKVIVSCKSSPNRSQTPDIPCVVAAYKARWGIPQGLRLAGGGETATATSGWNNNNTNNTTAAYGQPNNSSVPTSQAAQWNNNNNSSNNGQTQPQRPANNTSPQQPQTSAGNQVPPTSQSQPSQASQAPSTNQPQANGQAAVAPAAQNGGSGGGTWAQAAGKGLPPTSQTSANPPTPTSASTKQQLEQLNNMREALFSQDGWGAHVNQDSGWDIPSSPEPGQKDSNGTPLPPVWKPNVNNGTDLWEANLRNGGQPPPRVEKTTPWGSHTPASNIGGTWGVDDDIGDTSNMWNPQSQWPAGGPNQPQQPMWPGAGGGPKKEDWGGSSAGSNWGDPRDMPRGAPGALDPRDMPRGGDMRSMVDQRDPMRNVMDHNRGMVGGDVMMRGDPRGISGRLNGAGAEPMWPQQPPHHMPPAKPGAWPGGPPPKDKPNGWEEPSPPQQRRNIPNYDDGTSLWGSQQQQPQRTAMQATGPSKVSHWKDLPPAGMGRGMPPGMPQNRMAPNESIKANNPLWPHPARNGSWDGPHDLPGGGAPWPDDKVGVTAWNDPTLIGGGGPKYKMPWDGDINPMNPSTWDHPPKQPQKPLTKEIIWASKPFRVLCEMGYKKDGVEEALRSANMVLEDAIEILNWRGRHAELEPPFDHNNPPAFPSQRFNPQQLPFSHPGSSGNGPTGGQTLSNMSPAIVQKMMSQQPPPQQAPSQPPAPPYTQATRAQQPNQPSAHQLRMLVQQIQMAVQTGYLNHQILNQPLAPQTLILLNQLLQHIKVLHMHQQQMMQLQNTMGKPNSSPALLHNAVQVTKTKQQITNLQNQIQAQQAIYVKQQQHQIAPQQGGDFFKANVHDPLSALPSNFSDLAIKDTPQHSSTFQSQQSRLTQWKLPSLDKDGDLSSGEFSRAPGTTTKPSGGNSSPNLNPLLGQADGTWSRSNSEGGWPDSGSVADDAKDWPNTSQANSQAFTDLVPEFEPGKPWKGTQMKSIEDDPSITPGSVVRSPLSLATIKDTEIFSSGGKTSPTSTGSDMPIPPLSLSNNTWSFNLPVSSATASSSFTSPLGKQSGSKSTWGEVPPGGNELWGAPNKARGPPPGLTSKAPVTNGWGNQGGRWGGQPTPAAWAPNSTWLLLKNLTPQIDGSTLKTLCQQHGPLQNFHLYLNHSIALAKYTTGDVASKAQGALNNCVLVNTTVYAELLGENEVQSLLQHLSQGSGSGGGWGRGGAKGGDTWGTGWPPSNSGGSSLWGPDPPQDPHRSTPSSLNSFLPGDLLGPSDSI